MRKSIFLLQTFNAAMRKERESRGAAACVYASIIHRVVLGQESLVSADTVRFRLVIDTLREHVGLLLPAAAVTNLGLHQAIRHHSRCPVPQHTRKALQKRRDLKKKKDRKYTLN